MNYPRVNLLKKSEQRYQGAVSRRFMLISSVITPVLFIAILSGVKLIQFAGVQSDLESSREIWAELKPRLALHQEEQRCLNGNQKILELIGGWRSTQVSQYGLMSEIQSAVPANIQLNRLSIRSEPSTSVYREVEEFKLEYKLSLQGVSQGNQAEDTVIGFRKALLDTELMRATFDSVKLTSMRKQAGVAGQNLREFMLEGSTKEGGE
jgi:hypothetical protein